MTSRGDGGGGLDAEEDHDLHHEESDSFFASQALEHVRAEEKRPRYLIAACAVLLLLVVVLAVAMSAPGRRNKQHVDDGNSTEPEEIPFGAPYDDLSSSHLDAYDFSNISSSVDSARMYELQLEETVRYCQAASQTELSPHALRIKQADCGDGYLFRNSSSVSKPFKVLLLGSAWLKDNVRDLSGCPLGENKCPLSPKCVFVQADTYNSKDVDVSVAFQTQHHLKSQARYRVLYWREAIFPGPAVIAPEQYDFEMGVHYFAALPNPYFLETPRQYLLRVNGALMPSKPTTASSPAPANFAMSIISHCGARSQRDDYLQLINQLLKQRSSKQRAVHEYGACGKLTLPSKPLGRANEIIASYKFYMAFENEIQHGYVTEKLLYILALDGPVPVYFGSPQGTPKVTLTKSFINAADFATAGELVDYLLQLDADEARLQEYKQWRRTKAFADEYLDIMSSRIAGPEEQLAHVHVNRRRFPRTAQCCRLCDENFVKFAKENQPANQRRIGKPWTKQEILKKYFRK